MVSGAKGQRFESSRARHLPRFYSKLFLVWFSERLYVEVMKIFSIEFKSLLKQEWFIFLSINIFFTYAALIFLLISREETFRLISVLTFAVMILAGNIHRIVKGRRLKALYVMIAVLNVLSFPLAGGMSFSTTINFWPVIIASIYEITFGDGYGYGWPYALN